MAQTKRKRQTKHRGNAAGSVTSRGRTGRPPSPEERKKQSKEEQRLARLNKKPTLKMILQRAGLTCVVMFAVLLFATKGRSPLTAVVLAIVAFALYVPFGYYTEMWMWKRRMRKQGKPIT